MNDISVLLYVRHPDRGMTEITKGWIRMARATTDLPFELVVVEGSSMPDCWLDNDCGADELLQYNPGKGVAAEINLGLEACSGKYRVAVGNDVFVRPGWLEMLMEPFHLYGDCAISTLANSDSYSQQEPSDNIIEGFWGPLMMFDERWRVDGNYEYCFIDGDLAMTVYESGLRSYRSFKQIVTHGNQMTARSVHGHQGQADFLVRDRERFIRKHGATGSHLWLYHALINGWHF